MTNLFYSALDLGFWSTRPPDSSEVYHTTMSPTWPFLVAYLCLLIMEEKMAHRQKIGGRTKQAKKSQTNKVGHRSKWWLIKTTNDKEGGEYGVDYQDNDDDTFVKRKVNVRNIVNEHTTRSRLMS